MRADRSVRAVILIATLVGCLVAGAGVAETDRDTEAISLELAEMFHDDQAERREGRMNAARDRARLDRVREYLMTDKLTTPADYFHAAMIFQHSTDRTGRDHIVAHVLATMAAFEGHAGARWLSAAALDRALEFTGEKQFFGTQMRRNRKGQWVGGEHDRYRTEALRQAFEVRE